MNRIVREHYPVANLPEELRSQLHGVNEVRVVIEVRDEPEPELDDRPFSRWRHRARENFESLDEVVGSVRTLRDEWDERDQFHERLRSGP